MALARLAEVWRGPAVESVHHGVAAVSDAEGRLLAARGDPDLVTFPRSSLKPFQALALVGSGAAEGLDDAHLALACASHRAEPFQVAMVEAWLERLGLPESALVCGPTLPAGEEDAAAAIRAGGKRRLFHNCSGKHCGLLAASLALGVPAAGYERAEHEAQRLWMAGLSEALGRDAEALPRGTDGCGLPALALSVADVARAAARLAAGRLSPGRAAAARRILGAMTAHPDHLSGRGRPTSLVVAATGGRVALKEGAEGFVLAFAPEAGLGLAVKVMDGAGRGKMGALAALLAEAGLLGREEARALARAVEAPVLDSNGRPAGQVTIPALA